MQYKIDMAGPWVGELEERYVLDALRNGWYGDTAYSYCHTLEREFAKYHDRKYGLMTPNCTSAIHLLLAGLDISGPQDEIIVPECTWIATAAPITYQKANPVFADILNDSWCIDPQSVAARITANTRAVIAVNLYGNLCDFNSLTKLCKEKGIYLIEDAAESIGSTYQGVKSGKFGTASVFSFHRTKTMTTGEGGMLLLDDQELYERCKFLRDHGRAPGTLYNTEITFKYMPFNLQAALGYAQFKRIDELVAKKRWIMQCYLEELQSMPDLQFNLEANECFNSFWCSTVVVGNSYNINKQQLMEQLEKLGIPSRPFFYPLTSLPAYGSREAEYSKINPIAYDISNRGINLPSAMNITREQISQVAREIKQILEGKERKYKC